SGTARLILDGSDSYDPDGDPITWHWSFDHVPDASGSADSTSVFLNNNTDGASATSFLPDASGIYVIKLVIKDAAGLSSVADYVIAEVQDGNTPVADAGPDTQGDIGAAITLDGSGSYDPLGLGLTYNWVLGSVPSGSTLAGLDDATTATPSLTPDVGGVYVAALTVNNGFSTSTADAAYITVSSGKPMAPTAVAGPDITDAQDCLDFTLDGSGSYDPNGDALGYMWTLQSKPDGSTTDNYSMADRQSAITTFYADISGTYTFTLAVEDGTAWSAPDDLTVLVSERFANTPPVVDAGGLLEVDAGTALCSEGRPGDWECGMCSTVSVAVGGTATVEDAEGDPLELLWTTMTENMALTGPADQLETTVSITGSAAVSPGACAPNLYRMQLDATDCPQETGSSVLTLNVLCCGEVYTPDTGP
ncbi:MAG: hypothetical protein GXP62_18235, partial [Oligoflexia bacterium]|nr:hypothetical protein [Oligoflexia bacterium]